MKRLLTAFFFTAFLTFSFFAETIEGSVVVGAKDELPEGLFVKARGYLPGDIITLTNSYDGEKIQLLNLGTLDDDSEAAIVLSRESAEKLGITPGTKSPVTLETRSGSFDQRASGSALVTKTSAPKKEAAPVESYPEENSGDEFYGSFEESKNAVETPSPLDEKTDSTVQKEESASQKEKEVPAEKEAEPAAPSLEEEVEYEKFDADELPEDNEPKAEEPSKEDTQEEPSVSEQVEAEPENNEAASDTPEENEEPAASEEPDYEAFNPDELAEIEDETPPSEAPVSDEPAEEESSPEDTAQEEVVPEEPDEGEQFTPDELSAIEEKPEEAVPEEQLPVEENLPPENDLEGERVDSNEPVVSDDGELFADDVEPVTEEVKPVEEIVT